MTTYWHMQMHPDDKSFADEHIYNILENKKIIGLGEWVEGEAIISAFKNDVKVNDIVAIKNGAKLIALVQVIGGDYAVHDDNSEIGWIEHRRPIRVLDWEIWDKTLPQPRGTLVKCVNDVETTRIIRDWHTRISVVLTKRGVATSV
ncbi:hypothetical protein U1R68_13590 [Pectobacterium colocasium]|jgi:hypothetical protein|uniref:pyruvate kinase n=1 Tax=Pectobacterium TaxID=122277 RepID=UPI000B7BD9FC|nr:MULTISPECIES: pyruvate kinase [Pectobacterium]ASN84906.1 Hypothetical protein SCC1_1465 [Pectobacterium versatile]MBD0846177.1 pyruvate kinase [Pectobacterium carotovorum subsp. carotovorum]MBK4826772.1 hypothetical protein [Pectobacterium carotovorum subsp. carotovorum]MBQ4761362.1 pyruvate kinase [Pectobacterium versatile]MBQ4792710.1 pyruvate kinase [Pectobacterium versatile]